MVNWEVIHEKAMEIIEGHVNKSKQYLQLLNESYEDAKSHSDYKRIGLSIRKETLKLERLTSSDYIYKVRKIVEKELGGETQ